MLLTMERILLLLVLCTIVKAYHPKIPHQFKRAKCSQENEDIRNELIKRSKCGEPKDTFVFLNNGLKKFEYMVPEAIWVKRCVGLCNYDGHSCVPNSTVTRHIPVRVSSLSSGKESCWTFAVEEHLSCGCCNLSQDDCEGPKVFSRRKCTCQCPNGEERRNCLRKRNQNMRWNRSTCVCEAKRKT